MKLSRTFDNAAAARVAASKLRSDKARFSSAAIDLSISPTSGIGLVRALFRAAGCDHILAQRDRTQPPVAHQGRMLQRLDDLRPVVESAQAVLAQREVALERLGMDVGPESFDQPGDRFEAIGKRRQVAGKALEPRLDAEQAQVAALLEQAADRVEFFLELELGPVERLAGIRRDRSGRECGCVTERT